MARHRDRLPPSYAPDELRYAVRLDLFVRTAQTTLTFRNNLRQTALPVREWARSCCPMASAAPGFTGMPRPGASCRPISC
jgi:hypothetical protein